MVLPVIKWLWHTCCQLKHKIFFWLLVDNRLNTRTLLHRKNFYIAMETRDNLIFHCPFARTCWSYICTNWMSLQQGIQADINSLKLALGIPFSLEIIILVSWIFKGIPPSLYACRKKFKTELGWLSFRATRKNYANFGSWLGSFV